MPAARATRSVSVPVKVVRSSTPAHPVTPPAASAPVPPPTKPSTSTRPSVLQAPEAARRRMMWWVVGVSMAAIVSGWVALFGHEFRSRSFVDTTLQKIRETFSGLTFGNKKSSASEKEIRQLDSQVFPDLSQ